MTSEQNLAANQSVWTTFVGDPLQFTFFDQIIITHEETQLIQIPQKKFTFSVEDYLEIEAFNTKKPPLFLDSSHQKSLNRILRDEESLPQDRNSLKFLLRIFMKYHKSFQSEPQDLQRIIDSKQAYESICDGRQEKLNLVLSKYLFRESHHHKRNQEIFHEILNSRGIIQKELFDNGNVKNKKEYLFATKMAGIRCRSRQLMERAQTR